FCLAVEEIAWACASSAVIYLVQYAAGYPIVAHGTAAQKQRYLPRLASGAITAALSISEPGAGSDAASMTTTAVRKGDRYLLDAAVEYAKERRQFDRPIADFQGVQFMLADMAMQVHGARLMVHHAAALVDHGVTGTALEASMAKCFAADAAMRVATDAVQVFG